MRKIIIALISLFMIIPSFGVSADNAEKAKVYMFRGDGCPRCEEALEWFDSIKSEYGDYFELVTYEVWGNKNNNKLMLKAGKELGDEVTGVPYIVIGDNSYKGFDEESMAEDIISNIIKLYNTDVDERYDVIKIVDVPVKRNYFVDAIVIISTCLVAGGIVFLRLRNK